MGLFDLPADFIEQAEASAAFGLAIPKTARQGRDETTFFFTEHCFYKDMSSEKVKATYGGKECEILVLHLEIGVDATGSGLNGGKTFKTNLRINGYAKDNWGKAPAGSPEKKQHTMSMLAVAKLKQILRHAGIEGDLDEGGFSEHMICQLFPMIGDFNAEPSPLIGQEFWAEIKKSESLSADKTKTYTNYDINQFVDQ